jgi:hypothetical protein
MTHLQTNGHNNTDKEIKMAMERKIGKSPVKITGTAKSTGGNAKNEPMKKAEAKANLIQDITNRFRVTAREARDIVTSVGTAMNAEGKKQLNASNKNVVKQVKETAVAAVTGKKGTTSDQATLKMQKKVPNVYTKGTQR